MPALSQSIESAVVKLRAHALYVKQTPLYCELVYRPNENGIHVWQFAPTQDGIQGTMRAMGIEAAGDGPLDWYEAAVLTKILNHLMDRFDVHPVGIDSFAAR